MIGQVEKGNSKVQSRYIFHTLDEAKGYQSLNGGTINIITKQSDNTTVEIVESCPKMNNNEDLDSGTHRWHQESMYNIKDGLEYVKIICGPKKDKILRISNNWSTDIRF